MILIILLIAALMIVVGLRGTQSDLYSALSTDIPDFGIWAIAIVALGVIGYVPGLKPISKGLLALVIIVLVLNNYAPILSGFQNAFKTPAPDSGNGNSASPMNAINNLLTGGNVESSFSSSGLNDAVTSMGQAYSSGLAGGS